MRYIATIPIDRRGSTERGDRGPGAARGDGAFTGLIPAGGVHQAQPAVGAGRRTGDDKPEDDHGAEEDQRHDLAMDEARVGATIARLAVAIGERSTARAARTGSLHHPS